jgi:hypothetical protein
MVNLPLLSVKARQKIEATVRRDFKHAGSFQVQPDGKVDVLGVMRLNRQSKTGELPVQFGQIQGDLNIQDMKLTSLMHSGDKITGSLFANNNLFTDLTGAPAEVGNLILIGNRTLTNLMGCPQQIRKLQLWHTGLHSLEGLPDTPGTVQEIDITYDEHLPMLRLLVADKITVRKPGAGYAYLQEEKAIQEILNDARWVGKGKQGALNCALALKKAGYVGNASW